MVQPLADQEPRNGSAPGSSGSAERFSHQLHRGSLFNPDRPETVPATVRLRIDRQSDRRFGSPANLEQRFNKSELQLILSRRYIVRNKHSIVVEVVPRQPVSDIHIGQQVPALIAIAKAQYQRMLAVDRCYAGVLPPRGELQPPAGSHLFRPGETAQDKPVAQDRKSVV